MVHLFGALFEVIWVAVRGVFWGLEVLGQPSGGLPDVREVLPTDISDRRWAENQGRRISEESCRPSKVFDRKVIEAVGEIIKASSTETADVVRILNHSAIVGIHPLMVGVHPLMVSVHPLMVGVDPLTVGLHRAAVKALDLLRWHLRLLNSYAWHERCIWGHCASLSPSLSPPPREK